MVYGLRMTGIPWGKSLVPRPGIGGESGGANSITEFLLNTIGNHLEVENQATDRNTLLFFPGFPRLMIAAFVSRVKLT